MPDHPEMPLNCQSYLADTLHLSDAEHGRYMIMMMQLWLLPGQRFPNDDAWLARKFRRSEDEVREQLRPIIGEFFQADGNWLYQKRVQLTHERVVATSAKQSARAKSRWNKENGECRGNANMHCDPALPTRARADSESISTESESKIPPVSPSGETPPRADREPPARPGEGMTKRGAVRQAVEIWNRVCGDLLPKAEVLNEQRQRKLAKRLADDLGWKLEAWEAYCQRIRGSPFCCGMNDRAWRADLDFALAAGTYTKVVEGRYDPRPAKTQAGTGVQAFAPSGGGTSRSPMAGLRRVLPHLRSYESGAEEDSDPEPPEVAPKGNKPFLLTVPTEGNA